MAKNQSKMRGLVIFKVVAAWLSSYVSQSQAQPGFINIDCGATAESSDAHLSMSWSTDAGYINVGDNGVEQGNYTFDYNPVYGLNSFRTFSGPRDKSCYALPATPNITYLIRATFTPHNPSPQFDLMLDATTIKTVSNLSQFVEVVLKARRDSIYVCLVRTVPSDHPYISTLELRPLDPGMYPLVDAGSYLVKSARRNFGVNLTLLTRYPDDPFDRVWLGETANGQPINTTHAIAHGVAANKPPALVMSTAKLLEGSQYNYWVVNVQYYICMYFAEIDDRANLTSRRFDVTLDTAPWITSLSIVNSSGGLYTAMEVTGTYTPQTVPGVFIFAPDSGSNLGPSLNGFEIYEVIGNVTALTFWRDAIAIQDIKEHFNLTDWTGDPCSPPMYDWLNCSADASGPRISSLMFTNMNLSGSIPPSIGNLTAVTAMWLDNNHLSGLIPDLSQLISLKVLYLNHNSLDGVISQSLVALPSLQELYLQDNNLSGDLPSVGNNLIYNISGNPQLCKTSNACLFTHSVHKKVNVIAVVTGVTGGVVVTFLLFALCCLHRKVQTKKRESGSKGSTDQHSFPNCTHFTLREVKDASKDFSRKIGEGGFGPVYYGTLADGHEVAIKVLSCMSKQGLPEFLNEVDLLSRVHHKNLVSLIGACHVKERPMLIYEYLPNGTLQDHLYGSKMTASLSWTVRLHIALDAAQGLEYLHTKCNPKIIHRDIKSSNILLTSQMEAKVSDFGLSKRAGHEDITHISTLVKGTAGYLDPEYFISQKLTVMSDVYSFGVVLLELVCGQPPIIISPANPSQKVALAEWVRPHLHAGDLQEIVDPALHSAYSSESMWKVAEAAMMSVEPKESHRPNMIEVVQAIQEALMLEDQRTSHLRFQQRKDE